MKTVFQDKQATEFLLRIILDNYELEVISVKTEYVINNLHGRSVRLDIAATDSTKKIYNIEIQRSDKGAGEKRARYNLSMIDSNITEPGDDLESLPETYVIFITEKDHLGKGLPIYHVERVITETGDIFEDKSHIIYVNAEIVNDTPLGKLMHDFKCTDYRDMNYPMLSDKVKFFKEDEKGVGNMCRAMEEMRGEAAREAAEIATRIAEQKARKEIEAAEQKTKAAEQKTKAAEQKARKEKIEDIVNSIKNLTETLGLTAEKAMDALKISESEREQYRKLLAVK
jgi:predicted transposase/invertase (TIGR01784 family)